MIIVAGANGQLGSKIAHHLRWRGAAVRLLVRPGHRREELAAIARSGAVIEVDFSDKAALARACGGASCVVSALSGLDEVILDTQTRLLGASMEAGVSRFIPSDFCVDYTKLPAGRNRNLDLRRKFAERLDRTTAIRGTSIFNGMFTDLLVNTAPVVLFPLRTIVYWGSAEQPLDFTTSENTAAFTAAAAMDPETPRHLRIAGAVATVRDLRDAASAATGHRFHLVRAGGVGRLDLLSRVTRRVAPQKGEVFPAWQGMQYLRDMFEGQAALASHDNARYPGIVWTPIKEVLERRVAAEARAIDAQLTTNPAA